MRRIFTALLLLAILAAAGWLLLDWERKHTVPHDPWKAVPAHTAVIISIPDAWNNWDRFTHTSQLWQAFEQVPSFATAGRLLARTIERMQNDQKLKNALQDADVMVCLMRDGPGLGGLFIGSPREGSGGSALVAFSDIMGIDAEKLEALQAGRTIEVRPDTTIGALWIAMRDRTWLMATTASVMEEALLQYKGDGTLLQDPVLQRISSTMGGGADAHLLVHLRRAARLLDVWLDPAATEGIAMPDGWAVMDLRSRPDALLLSGLIAPVADDNGLSALREQGAGSFELRRVLPATVSAVDAWHISDPAAFMASAGVTGDEGSHAEELLGWTSGTAARAWAVNGNGMLLHWACFQAGDPETAREALATLCPQGRPCEQTEYRGILLQRTGLLNAHAKLLGPAFAAFEQPWYCLLGDVVLWSPTPEALNASIDAWHDGNSLAEEPRSAAWMQRISSSSARFFWCDVARSADMVRNWLKPSERERWNGIAGATEQLGGVSVQISPGQRGYYHVVAGLQFAPLKRPQGTGVLWSVEMDELVQRRPEIVKNHNNNTNELLVQDVSSKLHLIGSTGKILWSRTLDGPIMGKVVQVDKFRNGKLQLLLNTEQTVYLIDRNGKDVGGFPVRLREKAVQPLAVFDYDNTGEYRVIVPTADAALVNLDLDGKPVNGWSSAGPGATAACPVQHLRIKNKDHLVFADTRGSIHILDRRGAVRERTAVTLGDNPMITAIRPGPEIMASTITWRDGNGGFHEAAFHGSVAPLPTASNGSCLQGDVDGDGHMEFVRIAADTITVAGEKGVLFARSMGSTLATDVSLHDLDRKHVLGLVCGSGTVALLDERGRDLPGSPLEGTIPPAVADLNLDGIPELVTMTRGRNIIAYSLNGLHDAP